MVNTSGTHHSYKKIRKKTKNLNKMSKLEKERFFRKQNQKRKKKK